MNNITSVNHIVIANALHEIMTAEILGPEHNPRIMKYARDLGAVYPSDETAWCALFVNWVLWESKCLYASHNLLLARGLNVLPSPVFPINLDVGDIVVFHCGEFYGWRGHAGFFLNRNDNKLRILGGNQTNMVKVSEYPQDRFLFARRPTINPEANICATVCPHCSDIYLRCACEIS